MPPITQLRYRGHFSWFPTSYLHYGGLPPEYDRAQWPVSYRIHIEKRYETAFPEAPLRNRVPPIVEIPAEDSANPPPVVQLAVSCPFPPPLARSTAPARPKRAITRAGSGNITRPRPRMPETSLRNAFARARANPHPRTRPPRRRPEGRHPAHAPRARNGQVGHALHTVKQPTPPPARNRREGHHTAQSRANTGHRA